MADWVQLVLPVARAGRDEHFSRSGTGWHGWHDIILFDRSLRITRPYRMCCEYNTLDRFC